MTELIDQSREKYFFTRYNKKTRQFEQVDMISGTVTPLISHNSADLHDVHRFSKEVSGAICELVREGKTIAEIAREPGFPAAATIYNWKGLFPLFQEKLEAAFKDRAYHFQDKIIEDLDDMDSLHKDQVPAKKLQVDTTFKLMEKANPEKFGNKVQLSGDKDSPLQFVVDTGVRQAGDDGFDQDKFDAIDAEFTKKVEDEGNSTDEVEDFA